MSKIIYHVAMSLDGFIADHAGGVEWLPTPDATPAGEDFGFFSFYKKLSAVIMGSATYQQALTLSDDWPYQDVEAVVMTGRPLTHDRGGNVRFSTADPATVVADLRQAHKGDVWLVGGAALAASFAAQNLIDVYDIALMPTVLGNGIRLMNVTGPSQIQKLELMDQRRFSGGVLRLVYHLQR